MQLQPHSDFKALACCIEGQGLAGTRARRSFLLLDDLSAVIL
jgi:hypothetical protein